MLSKSNPIPMHSPEPENPTEVPRARETILLVEDEAIVLNLVSYVLLGEGYHVLQAANGIESLALAKQHLKGPVDLLITDLVMPLLGGVELARQLRAMWPDIKVLFITGYIVNEDGTINSQDLVAIGGDFLEKPFTPATLRAKVRELLGRTEESAEHDPAQESGR